ncbi:MAG: hypothetical protein M3H12_01100 [Chromatiales bacterium]
MNTIIVRRLFIKFQKFLCLKYLIINGPEGIGSLLGEYFIIGLAEDFLAG